jgi:hypothetical protein
MGIAKLRTRWLRAKEIARFLYIQRVTGLDQPTAPHFDAQTNIWFEQRLRTSKCYLEFGSGGSTVLAGKLGIPTISVEGDPYYAKAVRKAIPPGAPVTILTPRLGVTTGWSHPLRPSRTKARRYIAAPFGQMTGEFPDFVLIDGRYRVASALETVRQARERGAAFSLLVDDYEKRRRYHVLETWLGAPRRIGRSALFEVADAEVSKRDVAMFLGTPE